MRGRALVAAGLSHAASIGVSREPAPPRTSGSACCGLDDTKGGFRVPLVGHWLVGLPAAALLGLTTGLDWARGRRR
ncbi:MULTISPECIES: hypothetical protein [Streptomyces]|uniref:hypothetical protein n=1 Tax=Streptomyces TaxID=1883 RepID=UPI001F19BF3C|nr:hypothetical protein [Streptomyces sp. AMCC400023]